MNYNKSSKKVRNTVVAIIILSVLALILCFMLFRCGHEWIDATCTSPRTCTKCGKTEGEKISHTLTEANYQSPATCTVCGIEVGEPLTPYFEEHGYVCNITELNRPYDYRTRSYEDASILVNGKLVVTDYEIYLSDENHEALDGYEWRRVRFNCWFPLSEMENGGLTTNFTFDYYKKGEDSNADVDIGVQYPYSVNWNGIDYNDGLWELNTVENAYTYEDAFLNTDCWLYIWELDVRVPAGYDGVVFSVYNKTDEIEELIEAGKPFADIILSAEDTLSFRLN